VIRYGQQKLRPVGRPNDVGDVEIASGYPMGFPVDQIENPDFLVRRILVGIKRVE
jgi:hypothetical protein